jgi:putative transposase
MTKQKNKIRHELLDELLAGHSTPEEITGPNGLLKQLTGALIERALQAEMTGHLGYEAHARGGRGSGNSRNGTSPKRLTTDQGEVTIDVPRDRNGSFEPVLIKKHQRRFDGFDDKILSMYARGMSVRDIQAHLAEIYGTDVSHDLISIVTDAVVEELVTWQKRPLDAVWPIVYLDALVIKVRDQGVVRNKSVYVALGINVEGKKEILGLWIEANEGAKFWLMVMTELKNRGVEDMLIVCCDGLKGFPQAIEAVFPHALVQTCIVHMIRSSLRYVAWNNRKAVVADLKRIYQAGIETAAVAALDDFETKWGKKYPIAVTSWRSNWERIRPFFAFPSDIRKVIYTTNAIESLNFQLRKVTKAKGHFPNDEAAMKILYLALRNAEKKWTVSPHFWRTAMNQFTIHFEGRLPAV